MKPLGYSLGKLDFFYKAWVKNWSMLPVKTYAMVTRSLNVSIPTRLKCSSACYGTGYNWDIFAT